MLFSVYIETGQKTNAGSVTFNIDNTVVAATQTRTWKVRLMRVVINQNIFFQF